MNLKQICLPSDNKTMQMLIFVLYFLASAYAQLDDATQKALDQTVELLQNPTERKNAIQGDMQAMRTDSNVQALSGSSAISEEIYGLAADILGNMVRENNGDAKAMNQSLDNSQRDPLKFYQGLSNEQKAKIKSLSQEIETQRQSRQPASK